MKNVIVTADNRQPFPSGGIAFGEQDFGCRGGSRRTYEVYINAAAAAYLADGDQIRWWDRGSDCLPSISCAGEIIKVDGRRVQLVGGRDVGIDTGHPPRLRLKTKTRKGLAWRHQWDAPTLKVVQAPWGVWYTYTGSPPGLWGVKSHEEFMSWASNAQVFNGETIILSKNCRQKLVINYGPDDRGWTHGVLIPQEKAMDDIATDEPEIL